MTPVAPVKGPGGGIAAPRQVAPQRTPVTPARVRAAIAAAYTQQAGSAAPPALLDVLTAHVSHETARGERMFNYNLGGIKGTGAQGAVARYPTRELDAGGLEHRLVDGFRAYASLDEGAADYVKTMRSTFASALPAAAHGDADAFAATLKQRGYFTAHLDDYAASLRSLTHDASANGRVGSAAAVAAGAPVLGPLPNDASGAISLPTSDLVARVLDAVAGMSAEIGAPLDALRAPGESVTHLTVARVGP